MFWRNRNGDLIDIDFRDATIRAERLPDITDGRPWTVHVTSPRGVDVHTGHYASRRDAEYAAKRMALHETGTRR